MYILERKTMYIVPEAMTKNRTCQSYRWKQVCMCSDRSVLEEVLSEQSHSNDWRITETAEEVER